MRSILCGVKPLLCRAFGATALVHAEFQASSRSLVILQYCWDLGSQHNQTSRLLNLGIC